MKILAWIGPARNPGYMLAIVADGMGGDLAGDMASRLAVDTITAGFGDTGAQVIRR